MDAADPQDGSDRRAGIAELWSAIGTFREHAPGTRESRRRARQEQRLRELLSHEFLRRVDEALPAGEFARIVDANRGAPD